MSLAIREPLATQKVVIVNGSPDTLPLLETVLDAGHYDVMFVESTEQAYSHIKREQPNLVILCLRFDEADGFQILSMLKLDEATRDIPIVTYATEYNAADDEEEAAESSEVEMFALKPAPRMN